jgi:predicted MPP superfamily phosphohydrolase
MKKFPKLFTRRRFFGAGAAGFSGLGYMHYGEANWLECRERELKLGTKPVRILHLSDLHASLVVSLDFIAEAVDLGLKMKPDIICLTGDFITTKYKAFPEYCNVLRPLANAAPTFATMGNHDGGYWAKSTFGYDSWSEVGGMLRDAGVEVLHNESRVVEANGARVQLVGVGDMWSRELDANKAFAGASSELRTVLMSHNPDTKTELERFKWDLMLCGHTHGGQARFPFFGTPFAPVKDMNYVDDLRPWRDRWIHVTRGVGNLHGVRLNCRPEVSVVTLWV